MHFCSKPVAFELAIHHAARSIVDAWPSHAPEKLSEQERSRVKANMVVQRFNVFIDLK